jgi:hypothetical protein
VAAEVGADRSAAEKRRPVAFGVDVDDPASTELIGSGAPEVAPMRAMVRAESVIAR